MSRYVSMPAGVPLGHPAQPSAAEMSRMLSSLARKGASLRPARDSTETRAKAYILSIPGDARGRRKSDADAPARPVHGDLVRYAAERGWLSDDAGSFRLNEAGALALRRGLEPGPTRAPVEPMPTLPHANHGGLNPIARLRQRRDAHGRALVSGVQSDAADRLARDFNSGHMQPRVTSNWTRLALGSGGERNTGSTGGRDVADAVSAAQERVRRALSDAGPEFADLLMDICCLEQGLETVERQRGWPHRSAKIILGLALDKLSRHYGLVAVGPARSQATTHWGAEGYRPAVQPAPDLRGRPSGDDA
jgi:Domain of unknown function (DUF6456)